MRVTELLMRPGGWSMDLLPSAPPSIVNAVRAALATYDSTNERWTPVMDGQIVVFDTDVRTPTLARARYTGILEIQSGDRSFSGPGLAAYLETDDGLGVFPPTTDGSGNEAFTANSLGDVVTILDTTYSATNGLTLGTDYTSAGAAISQPFTIGPIGAREVLDSFATSFGQEWRCNPDGTIDTGLPADGLFVTAPTVLVDAKPGGSFGAIRRINGTASSLTIDCSQLSSKVVAYPADAGVPEEVNSTDPIGKGLDGTTLARTRVVDASADASDVSGVSLGQAAVDLFSYPRSSFSVMAGDRFVRRLVQPGDSVYAYFPVAGIKSGNALSVGAETVYPQKVRVHEMDYGIHEGHGVFLRRHNGVSETWLRLTQYVQFSDAGSTWKVGTERGVLDDAALKGAARLGADGIDASWTSADGPVTDATGTPGPASTSWSDGSSGRGYSTWRGPVGSTFADSAYGGMGGIRE